MTLYTQVDSNRHKTWFFLSFYVVLIWLAGWIASRFFGSPSILVVFGVISIVQGFISYRFSDSIALTVAKAKPLERESAERVYRVMENLTITAGMPMPRLFVIDDTALNAFATGRDKDHAAIAMTSGLIDQLDDNELAGVLGHELSHIGNEDIRLMSMVAVMAGLIALISDVMLRSMFYGRRRSNSDNDGGGAIIIIAIIFAVLAPIAASLIQLAISRKREYMADANSVLLTRYPEGLISALKKISGDVEPLEVANRGTAHMYFANPLHGQWFASLFSTHPPVEQRIKALEEGSGAVPTA